MDYFRIGLFLRPHGIKGELKLLPLTDNLKRFARLSDAFIEAPEGAITGEDVNNYFPQKCERLLIKGGGKAYFHSSAAEELADIGLKLIGTDSLSVGTKGDQTAPHKAFLGAGICVLEGLDLSEVSPGSYYLFAAPVKLGGLEGAPVRAVLIDDYIFWGGR